MKTNSYLKPHDLDQITQSTRIAEKMTSGEIVTLLTDTCDTYQSYILYASLIATLLASTLCLIFSSCLLNLIRTVLWEVEFIHALLLFFFCQVLVFAAVYLLALIPAIKYHLIPYKRKQEKVRLKAESSFYRHAISSTRGATGVLIFVSFFERRVELLVDSAISSHIPDETWHVIVDHIIQGIKTSRFTQVLCSEIINCGELLAPEFPIRSDDVNELSDNPIIE
jgi:putative membrane protein